METISFIDRSGSHSKFVTKNLQLVSNVFCFYDEHKRRWVVSLSCVDENANIAGLFEGDNAKDNARNFYRWLLLKIQAGTTVSEEVLESAKRSCGGN